MKQMLGKTNTGRSVYYLFTSREKAWLLTAFAVISVLMAVRDLVSSSTVLQFSNARFRIFAFVMEGVSAIVLSYWIAKASDKLERAFIALWLIGWVALWCAPLYNAAGLLAVRYANVLVWVVATVIALKITRAETAMQ